MTRGIFRSFSCSSQARGNIRPSISPRALPPLKKLQKQMSPSGSKSIGPIEFINVSHPGSKAHISKHRALIQSHAAHVTHARVRNARTRKYQSIKTAAAQQPGGPDPAEDKITGTTNLPRVHNPSKLSIAEPKTERTVTFMAGPLKTALDASKKDPFTSFVDHIAPVEHLLLDHYVTAVIPYLNSHCQRMKARGLEYLANMSNEWIFFALNNAGLLKGLFLTASRHLAEIYGQQGQVQQQHRFTDLAVRYKLICVQDLNRAISSGAETMLFSDAVVAQTMLLALDEITLGDLAMSRYHVQGAITMVELKGGPQTLGLNGFLEMIFNKYVGEVGALVQVPVAPCPGLISHAVGDGRA